MKTIVSIVIFILILFKINGQIDTFFWGNSQIKEIHFYERFDKYIVESYHPNGKLHYLGNVELWDNLNFWPNIETAFDKDGNQTIFHGTGTFYEYYEDLNIKSVSQFCEMNQCLDYKEYYSNGTLKIKGNYGGYNGLMDKQKQGVWQFFDEKGALVEEREYVNGNEYYLNAWFNGKQTLKNGKGFLKLFFSSGKVKSEGKIREKKKWGVWKEFHPEGNLSSKIKYFAKKNIEYEHHIRFEEKLIKSINRKDSIIGNSGNGYRLTYRQDATLETKKHYSNDKLDSIYTFYGNGDIYKIIVIKNNNETTEKCFYSNGKIAFNRISENESHYFDEKGLLIEKITTKEINNNPDESETTSTRFYTNGNVKEIEICIITLVLTEFGEYVYMYDCDQKKWDLDGNEVK